MEQTTLRVYILDAPYHIDKPYDYLYNFNLHENIRAGAFVEVPFGRGRRKALVTSVGEPTNLSLDKLKTIIRPIDEEIWLNEWQVSLCFFMKEHTFCTIGDSVRSITPTIVKKVYDFSFYIEEKANDYLSGKCKLRSSNQFAILKFVYENPGSSLDVIKKSLNVSSTQINSLESKGLILRKSINSFRNPYAPKDENSARPKNVLNEEQTQAKNKLLSLLCSSQPKAALLHGVTGSGKTRVIIAMTDEALSQGKQVIILVPEISLTPQALSLFSTYYGDNIAVVHSSLSAGERFDAWRRMKQGLANVCIGTRSAIFAPFDNLGLIVIDEEQEHTYKSDSNPKYNAIDIARFRCAKTNSLLLLASATPSLNSYYKAKTGKYELVELKNRYGNVSLPNAIIADMRGDYYAGEESSIGPVLKHELRNALKDGKQAIIFINRRGYNHFVSCPQCGVTLLCPHCSVSLTHHSTKKGSELRCHYCGYKTPMPSKCPSCDGEHLRYIGYGIQKVEQELNELFPDKKIIRMDADTTQTKFSHNAILQSFRNHEGDILLGTQMVTKGHDFPDVAVSGILLADMSLYVDDYRANERTFSQITQVIGRAGRAGSIGNAVIQTFNPDHPVLKLAAKQDYHTFYEEEIALRKSLLYPPFCDIFHITFNGKNESEVLQSTVDFTSSLKKKLKEVDPKNVTLQIFGPLESVVYKVNESYRMRLVIKGKSNTHTRFLFSELMKEYETKFKSVNISIDINPNSL